MEAAWVLARAALQIINALSLIFVLGHFSLAGGISVLDKRQASASVERAQILMSPLTSRQQLVSGGKSAGWPKSASPLLATFLRIQRSN